MTQTEDLALFAGAAERFAGAVVLPAAAELDAPDGVVLTDVLGRAENLGMLSLFEQDIDALAALLRPIARVHAGLAALLFVQAGAQKLVTATGAWPCTLAAGELLAWPAFARADEPSGVELDARRGRVDGALRLVPLACRARRLALVAHDSEGRLALMLIDVEARGVSRAPVDVLGLQCCAAADVTLDGAEATLVGYLEPSALSELAAALSLAVTAIALGLIEGSFVSALEYARQRRQGARRIVDWLEVRRLLAGARESALVTSAALDGVLQARRAGARGWREAALALAVSATESACEATTDGVQLLGGYGYIKQYPQERRMRDARQARSLLGPAAARQRAAFDAWLCDE